MNFLKKIFPFTLFTISFFLFIYIFYKSEFYWNGSRRSYYTIYYIVSLILIFISFFYFFINEKTKEYLLISLTSLVLGLYIFEGYLIFKKQISKNQRLEAQNLKSKLYEKQSNKKWDNRTKLEIYNNLKKKNNKITTVVSPKNYTTKNNQIVLLSGVSNSTTIYCNENGYYSIFKSDRYGFNNPNEEWDSKEIEYLLIGDSFTLGACVNRPNDIASVLRTLSNKSVLNLGYSGTGPLIQFATLREYLKPNVKKVLWIYFEGNDLDGLISERDDSILKNYLNNSKFTQNLKFKQNEIDEFLKKVIVIAEEREEKIIRSKLKEFIKINNTRKLFHFKKAPISDFKKILNSTKKLVNKNNATLYFVYLPEYSRYKRNFNKSTYESVKNVVSELNIPLIDISKETFEKETNPLKFFAFDFDSHYSVEGYRKVSQTIYKLTKD